MVVIRLARSGAKKRPFYRVVVTDSRNPRDGRFIERLGYYNPLASDNTSTSLMLNMERIQYWQSVGAQPSPAAKKLMRRFQSAAASAS